MSDDTATTSPTDDTPPPAHLLDMGGGADVQLERALYVAGGLQSHAPTGDLHDDICRLRGLMWVVATLRAPAAAGNEQALQMGKLTADYIRQVWHVHDKVPDCVSERDRLAQSTIRRRHGMRPLHRVGQ